MKTYEADMCTVQCKMRVIQCRYTDDVDNAGESDILVSRVAVSVLSQ